MQERKLYVCILYVLYVHVVGFFNNKWCSMLHRVWSIRISAERSWAGGLSGSSAHVWDQYGAERSRKPRWPYFRGVDEVVGLEQETKATGGARTVEGSTVLVNMLHVSCFVVEGMRRVSGSDWDLYFEEAENGVRK